MNAKMKSIKEKLNYGLEKYKIKSGAAYVNQSMNQLYKRFHQCIVWTAKHIDKVGISANITSMTGFAIGLLAINFLSLNMYWWALLCIVLNRLFDAVDGEIARHSKVTEFGVFLDAALDYIFYTGVIFGFALANPWQNAVAASFLLFAFAASACAMLAYAVVAYKDKALSKVKLDKSPFYLGGFAQGAEIFVAIVIMCLIPSWFMQLAMLFGVLCLVKAFSIIVTAYYNFVVAADKK